MKKIILALSLFLCPLSSVFAQYNVPQNDVWAFGNNAGVSFITGSPVAITTAMTSSSSEGCASVSDASGNLLFYTDGYDIWDRTNAIMPSGSSIVPFLTSSTSQAALIIPVIGSTTQYYVFSLESLSGSGRLEYCIVDMTLHGGLGDVIASSLGTSLNSSMGEHQIAVAGNNCDIWLITHKESGVDFYAYDITAAGIGSPVVSSVGTFTASLGYSIGQFKISPDRTKLSVTCYNGGSYVADGVGVELYDFNASTGVVSNVRRLDSLVCAYGSEISPDNTKLYICSNSGSSGPTKLEQFDITGSTAAAIRATRTTINTTSVACWPSIKLAPDNKMYMGSMTAATSPFLDCISSPNASGSSCGFSSHAVRLATGSNVIYGLPNLVFVVGNGDTTIKIHDTTLCIPIAGLTLNADTTGLSYLWSSGTTASSFSAGTAGTYWVNINNSCHLNVDTFHVMTPAPDTIEHIHDTTVCIAFFPIRLTATNIPGSITTATWIGGGTGSTFSAFTAGTYWARGQDTCHNVTIDTFHVTFILPDTTAGSASSYAPCISMAPLTLTAMGSYTSAYWSTGASGSSINVSTSGDYLAFKFSGCSAIADTFHVNFISMPVLSLGPDVSMCAGDSVVLSSSQPAGTLFTWSTGSTADSIHVSSTGTYWLSLNNGCIISDTINILVSPYPVVDLGPDTFNCQGGAVTLQSLFSYPFPIYLWSTGASTSSISATSTGDYWLSVNVNGCASADTIHVTIKYDTFTLVNRDTAICNGKVVQAVLYANPAATFQWLPTAGIAVSNISSPVITPDTSAEYKVNIYLSGCPTISDSFHVEVEPVPTVYIGGNKFVCQFDTIHINASVQPQWYGGYTYSWSPTTSLDFSNTKDVVFTAGVSQKYILTVTTDSAHCVGKDSAQITVQAGSFGGISPDTSICPHDLAPLRATGGGSYRWLPSLYLDDSVVADPVSTPVSTTTYTVIITSPQGCHDTLTVNVHINPAAVISLEDSITIYPGETAQLSPYTNCNSFNWFPLAGLNSHIVSNPIVSPGVDTKYYVYGTTSDGCVTLDSISVHVASESLLTLPNAFTPGNGPNGKFFVIRRGDANLNYFRIYNRWGNIVFETKDINEGWDGNYNGKPQPLGVYVYDIQAVTDAGLLFNKHGNVTLLR